MSRVWWQQADSGQAPTVFHSYNLKYFAERRRLHYNSLDKDFKNPITKEIIILIEIIKYSRAKKK